MIEKIFNYINKEIGSDDNISIPYETIEKEFNINFEEFQKIARDNSNSFGFVSKPTKDNIGFTKNGKRLYEESIKED